MRQSNLTNPLDIIRMIYKEVEAGGLSRETWKLSGIFSGIKAVARREISSVIDEKNS